jgi:hypothetical protein
LRGGRDRTGARRPWETETIYHDRLCAGATPGAPVRPALAVDWPDCGAGDDDGGARRRQEVVAEAGAVVTEARSGAGGVRRRQPHTVGGLIGATAVRLGLEFWVIEVETAPVRLEGVRGRRQTNGGRQCGKSAPSPPRPRAGGGQWMRPEGGRRQRWTEKAARDGESHDTLENGVCTRVQKQSPWAYASDTAR